MKRKLAASKKQIGVGLIEVLVALMVVSIGLLGVASLYTSSLQAKTTSLSRLKAVSLASDIADRIRANPTAVASYLLSVAGTTTATNCATATCTDTQMAASDLNQWNTNITSSVTGLPGGAAVKRSIVQTTAATATTPAVLTITLIWREASAGANDLSYSLQVQI
jgi:type IV pilus assembly protein PilV